MKIYLKKGADVSIVDQLVGQVEFMIATGELRAGDVLPSSRELERRFRISRNTVGPAYRILKEKGWVESRRGAKVAVRDLSKSEKASIVDGLDRLIADFITTSRQRGYTLRQLAMRLQAQLIEQPPDHVLVVTNEEAIGRILELEFETSLPLQVERCATGELIDNPSLALGALVVTTPGQIKKVAHILPTGRPALPVEFSTADSQIRRLSTLQEASVIGLISISPLFLQTAKAVIGPVVGDRHQLVDFLVESETPALGGIDLAISDIVVDRQVQNRKLYCYRLASQGFIAALFSEMNVGGDTQ